MSSRGRGRRILRRLLIGFVGLVALVLVLVGSALMVAMTDWGNEKIRAFALEKVNAGIYGELVATRLSFKGGHVVLEGVELKDPDGERVASVQKVEVRIQLGALLHKTINIQSVELLKPEVYIVQEDGSSNLQRAIKPRNPKPKEEKPPAEGGPSIVLGRLSLRDGTIELEQRTPQGVSAYHVTDLTADASAKIANGGDGAMEAAIEVGGLIAEPLEGPLALSLKVNGNGEVRAVTLSAQAPGVDVGLNGKTLNENDADVFLQKLSVEPSALKAFVASWPLLTAVSAEGAVHKRGTAVTARIGATSGAAVMTLDASADTAARTVEKLAVQLSNVNLAELIEDGPASDVALSLNASGGGSTADDVRGKLTLSAPASTMEGHPFGPIDLRVSVDRGIADIEKFLAVLPGIRITADGSASKEKVDVSLHVDAKDLRTFSKTLGTLAKLDVGGSGKLNVSAKGATQNPAIELDGAFPSLRYQTKKLTNLSLKASLPEAKDPFTLDATVRADKLQLDASRPMGLDMLAFDMRTQARQLVIEARARGLAVLSLTLQALVDQDRKGMELQQLTVSYPEATWALKQPSHLRFDSDELSAKKLTLTAGDQSLFIDGSKRGNDLDGRVSVKKLDLGKLPRMVLDPLLKLGGTLSVDAEASGTTKNPELKVQVALRNGRFKQIEKLQLSVDGLYRRDRVTGNLDADGVGTKLTADFDVPIAALKARRAEPVRVIAKVRELDLDRLAASGFKVPVKGFFAGSLELKGLASDPKLKLELTARDLAYEQLPKISGKLVMRSAEHSKLVARLDVQMLEKTGFAELATPWSLGRLISRPPTKGEAMRAPLRLRADFKEFPLPIPYTANVTDQLVTGTISIDADMKGSLLKPDGRLSARLAGLSRGRSPVIEAVIEAVAKPDQIRISVDAVRQKDKQKLVELVAVLDAPPSKLTNPEALDRLPLKLNGVIGPIGVGDLQSIITPPRRAGTSVGVRMQQPPLEGTLEAKLEGSGTLGDPKLVLRTNVKGLGSPGVKPGDVSLTYDYEDAKHDLAVALKGPTGGELKLTANTRLDISLRGMRKGFDATALPIVAELKSSDFDPQFLSGVSPKIRKLGGHIESNVTVKGTPTQPNVDGKLEWKEGLISVAGSGRYEAIHLLVEGNNKRLEIKELVTKASEGNAKLYLLAEDVGDRFTIKAKVEMNEFPIVTLDQLAATVSTRATMDGAATRTMLNIDRLHIAEAHILLPDIKRKNLQQLDLPKDVIFTKRGKPVEEENQKVVAQSGTGGSGAPKPAQTPAGFQISARVFGPRNIWIKSKDINVEVGFGDDFKVLIAGGPPQLFGEVVVQRGRLDVVGRRFDLKRDSKVRFTGKADRPTLDVTAVHNNEREDVKVFLAVSGPANKLEIKPTSEPPLTETEIFTLLATGRRSLRPGSGGATSSGNGAASVVGSFAAGQLKKTLSNKLPLDVLSIEAGDAGLQGTKVEAGTYVNDKLYLGFTGRVGANPNRGENSNAVRLEYQLSRRWSFEAEYGDAKAGGADLIWSKEY